MIADEMSLEAFDAILNRAEFKVLDYPARYAYEGAGPRCLYARVGDDLDILYEAGVYTVQGWDDDLEEGWVVSFTDDGDREILF